MQLTYAFLFLLSFTVTTSKTLIAVDIENVGGYIQLLSEFTRIAKHLDYEIRIYTNMRHQWITPTMNCANHPYKHIAADNNLKNAADKALIQDIEQYLPASKLDAANLTKKQRKALNEKMFLKKKALIQASQQTKKIEAPPTKHSGVLPFDVIIIVSRDFIFQRTINKWKMERKVNKIQFYNGVFGVDELLSMVCPFHQIAIN